MLDSTIISLAVFAFAAVHDLLSCHWLRAAGDGRRGVAVGVSGALELLQWLPVWLAIEFADPWIVVSSVVGSMVGTMLGLKPKPSEVMGDVEGQQREFDELERRAEIARSLPVARVVRRAA